MWIEMNVCSLTKWVGGDSLGSASDVLYTPDGLVQQAKINDQPVIYVGINYRLGGKHIDNERVLLC